LFRAVIEDYYNSNNIKQASDSAAQTIYFPIFRKQYRVVEKLSSISILLYVACMANKLLQ